MTFGNLKISDKILNLILFTICVWAFILYKSLSFPKTNHIKCTILQQKRAIKSIDDRLATIKKETLYLDYIYFPPGKVLKQHLYGTLGYKRNFFMILKAKMYLKKAQDIEFIVFSDDGFRLKIDGKKLIEFTKDRPYKGNKKSIKLQKGLHYITLKYFQGYGDLGLGAWYKDENGNKKPIGYDSRYVTFKDIR